MSLWKKTNISHGCNNVGTISASSEIVGADLRVCPNFMEGIMGTNQNKIILDLCGGTGSWSKPYKDAGYSKRTIMRSMTPEGFAKAFYEANR